MLPPLSTVELIFLSESDENDVEEKEVLKVRDRSIEHHMFKQDKFVFVSLDLETGEENIDIT